MSAKNCKNFNLTANMEDYIETIALLAEKTTVVRVKDIASSLDIKMPSVSAALNKLKEKGLIDYEKYGYIELTSKGKKAAEQVYNKHKILKEFMTQILDISPTEANDEACQLEHYLSSETCDKISLLTQFIKNRKDSAEFIKKLNAYYKS